MLRQWALIGLRLNLFLGTGATREGEQAKGPRVIQSVFFAAQVRIASCDSVGGSCACEDPLVDPAGSWILWSFGPMELVGWRRVWSRLGRDGQLSEQVASHFVLKLCFTRAYSGFGPRVSES